MDAILERLKNWFRDTILDAISYFGDIIALNDDMRLLYSKILMDGTVAQKQITSPSEQTADEKSESGLPAINTTGSDSQSDETGTPGESPSGADVRAGDAAPVVEPETTEPKTEPQTFTPAALHGTAEEIAQMEEAGWDEGSLVELSSAFTRAFFGGVARLTGNQIRIRVMTRVRFAQTTIGELDVDVSPNAEDHVIKRDGLFHIMVNGDILRPDALFHEAGHIWEAWAKEHAKGLYARAMAIIVKTSGYKLAKALLCKPCRHFFFWPAAVSLN